MNHLHTTFLKIRSKYVSTGCRKPRGREFFDDHLTSLKNQVKSCRRQVSRLRKRDRNSNQLSLKEKEYKDIRLRYGKKFDRKQKAHLEDLERRTVDSLSSED